MSKLLVLVALFSLGLGSCAPAKRFWVAPHQTTRFYHQQQRKHARERRRVARRAGAEPRLGLAAPH